MSSKTIRGKLEKCFKNKHGFWSVKVQDEWHNCAKNNYTELEGNIVEFEISKNKKGYWDVSSEVKVVAASPAERSSGGGGGRASSTQVSIERQGAYKAGVEIVLSLVDGDKLGVGAKGKAFDNVLGLIDAAAQHIYEGVSAEVPFHGIGADEDEDQQAPGPGAEFEEQEA